MFVVLAFLLGAAVGVALAGFAIVADDDLDVAYKDGYFEGYSDGKEARKDDDSGRDKKKLRAGKEA